MIALADGPSARPMQPFVYRDLLGLVYLQAPRGGDAGMVLRCLRQEPA
jgi:hypothetical protein